MNRLTITLVAALGVTASGCATGRLEKTRFGTANARFSVAEDLVIVRGNNGDRQNRAEQLQRNSLKYSAGNLVTLLHDYYAASALVREMEFVKATNRPSAGPVLADPDDGELGRPNLAAIDNPDYAKALVTYRAAGFDASRGVCRYALNLLGESHSDYKFLNKSGNLFTGAGASLMGILDASARSTSLYAVGTSLYQAWSQDFEEYAYLTASIGTIGRKVTAAQDAYREGIEYGSPKGSEIQPPRSWSEATVQIQRYNDFCLATGMRALVEEAVGKADVYFDPDRNDVEVMNTSAAEIRRAIEGVRQQQRSYRELRNQHDVAQSEREALEDGLRAREKARSLLAELSGNPYYTAAGNTVRVDAADADRDAARAALESAIANSAADVESRKRTYEQATRLAGEARRILRAVRIIDRYNSEWEKARTDAITRAEAQIRQLDQALTPTQGGS